MQRPHRSSLANLALRSRRAPRRLRGRSLMEGLESRVHLDGSFHFQSVGAGGGGALYSPSINPANTAEFYVASDLATPYRSLDAAKSWKAVDYGQLQSDRYSQVQFTDDPNVRYVLDYTILPPDFSYNLFVDGAGVPKKSTDGGQTWKRVPGWTADGDAWVLFANPQNKNQLVVGTYTDLRVSQDGGNTFGAAKFAYDAGDGLMIAGAVFDGQNIYLGTNAGLVVSRDGGNTFALEPHAGLPAGKVISSFAGGKGADGTLRFYAVTTDRGSVRPGVAQAEAGVRHGYGGLFTLTPTPGASWAAASTGIPTAAQRTYLTFVAAPRNDAQVAYVGGIDETTDYPVVYKTTDGGGHWAQRFLAQNNQNVVTGAAGYHGDQDWYFGGVVSGLAVSPTDAAGANTVVFTDYGYLHVSTDGGGSWRQGYTAAADQNPAGQPTPKNRAYHGIGLEQTTAWSVDWGGPQNPVTGFTDVTGFFSTDGGASWAYGKYNAARLNTTSSFARQVSGNAVTLYASTSSVHDFYQDGWLGDARLDNPAADGQVIRSTDGGANWALVHSFGHPVVWAQLDPFHANRMYVSVVDHSGGTGGVYVTNDLQDGTASAWQRLTAPPRTEGHPYDVRVLDATHLVVSYSARQGTISPGVEGFTESSGVFLATLNAQGQVVQWQDRSAPGMRFYTLDVVVDPANPNRWYAAVRSGYGGDGRSNDKGGLYMTTDQGLNWTRVFDKDGVESLTIDPATGARYMTTVRVGLWYAADAAQPFARVPADQYPHRHPLRVFLNPYKPSEVWVTSFGGGVMVGGGTQAAPGPRVTAASAALAAKPHQVNVRFDRNVAATASADDFRVQNLTTGTPVPGPYYFEYRGGDDSVNLAFPGVPDARLPDGRYRVTVLAAGITNAAGRPLDGNGDGVGGDDYAFDFYVLAGDANFDGTVDFNDLVPLAQNYNTAGKTYPQGDFNYDGAVDFNDLVIVAQRYNTTLVPQAAAPGPAAAAALPALKAWEQAAAAAPRDRTTGNKRIFSAIPVTKPAASKAMPARRRAV